MQQNSPYRKMLIGLTPWVMYLLSYSFKCWTYSKIMHTNSMYFKCVIIYIGISHLNPLKTKVFLHKITIDFHPISSPYFDLVAHLIIRDITEFYTNIASVFPIWIMETLLFDKIHCLNIVLKRYLNFSK
jgi:hypothetical protein